LIVLQHQIRQQSPYISSRPDEGKVCTEWIDAGTDAAVGQYRLTGIEITANKLATPVLCGERCGCKHVRRKHHDASLNYS
jgi:hypothetical protein